MTTRDPATPRSILLLPNEPQTIDDIGGVLGDAGFAVNAVSSLAAVLKTIKHSIPTAVIIDLTLPSFGGDHVLHVLKQTHPTLPILALADSASALRGGTTESLGIRVLIKPFTAEALLAALRECAVGSNTPESAVL